MPRALWFVMLSAAACAAPSLPSPWESRLASALSTRAETLAVAGHDQRARSTAQEALELAVRIGDRTCEARALHVLGLIDHSPEQLARALELFAREGSSRELSELRLDLAGLALASGDGETALVHLERTLEEAGRWDDRRRRALTETRAFHLRAEVLRGAGRVREAHTEQRRAELASSLLAEDELLDLRSSIYLRLGDDYAGLGRHRTAFESHARSSALARRAGDARAELRALIAQGRDLAAMGRVEDAAHQAARTLRTALGLEDVPAARMVAREALVWLDALREPPASSLRRPFLEALAGEGAAVSPGNVDG